MNCLWCETPFEAKTQGGREKRFCSDQCRYAFRASSLQFTIKLIDRALVSAKDVRTQNTSNLTVRYRGGPKSASQTDEAA